MTPSKNLEDITIERTFYLVNNVLSNLLYYKINKDIPKKYVLLILILQIWCGKGVLVETHIDPKTFSTTDVSFDFIRTPWLKIVENLELSENNSNIRACG